MVHLFIDLYTTKNSFPASFVVDVKAEKFQGILHTEITYLPNHPM